MQKKLGVLVVVLVLLVRVSVSAVMAQDASPSATPSSSPGVSPSPTSSPRVSPSPTPESGTGGATSSPQPTASSSGQVLGGTDKLAETASTKEWLFYTLVGLIVLGVIGYGIKLVHTPHVEE